MEGFHLHLFPFHFLLVHLKYGFCKKLLRYKWTSDQLNPFVLLFSRSAVTVTSYKIHTLEDGETLIFNRLCPCSRALRPASMALKKTKAFKRTTLAGTYNFVQILPCLISIWINEIGFNTQILKGVKTRTGVTFLLIRIRFLPIEKEKTSHSFWTKIVNSSKCVRPALMALKKAKAFKRTKVTF